MPVLIKFKEGNEKDYGFAVLPIENVAFYTILQTYLRNIGQYGSIYIPIKDAETEELLDERMYTMKEFGGLFTVYQISPTQAYTIITLLGVYYGPTIESHMNVLLEDTI